MRKFSLKPRYEAFVHPQIAQAHTITGGLGAVLDPLRQHSGQQSRAPYQQATHGIAQGFAAAGHQALHDPPPDQAVKIQSVSVAGLLVAHFGAIPVCSLVFRTDPEHLPN
jgi:hypothetical protein